MKRRNNNLLKLAGIFCLFFLCIPSLSATDTDISANDSVRLLLKKARHLKYGINCDINYEEAARIYRYLIRNHNSSQAMSELGLLYRNGEGVEQNYQIALSLFGKATELGNSDAACNLALLYQKAEGVGQNSKLAFRLYKKAAEADNPRGYYGTGYCYYKGFGVKQDYEKAVAYLEKGADRGHAGCIYLLSTYYNNGYSPEEEYDKGIEYLNKALKAGHGWTYDVAKDNRLDSLRRERKRNKSHYSWTDTKNSRIRLEKEKIENKADAYELEGTWTGKYYTYDWGGKKIVSEEDIQLKIGVNGDNIHMDWYDPSSETLIMDFPAEKKEKAWRTLNNLYDYENWALSQAKFDIRKSDKDTLLYVDFRRVSIKTREPQKPSIAILERRSEEVQPLIIEKVYPMPFSGEINVEFTLLSQQQVRYEIYHVTGNLVYSSPFISYKEGVNTESLNVNLNKGNYVLHLIGNDFSVSKNITRK